MKNKNEKKNLPPIVLSGPDTGKSYSQPAKKHIACSYREKDINKN